MMTRLQFLRSLAGVGVGVVGAAALVGCKPDEDSSTPDAATQGTPDAPLPRDAAIDSPIQSPIDAPPMACTTASSTIGTNHGHTLAIPPADIAAATDRTYNIKGTSAHPHTVVITAAMFAMLKANGTLAVTSSSDAGHTHAVTITCA